MKVEEPFCTVDLTGRRILSSRDAVLIEPITVPPAYSEVPEAHEVDHPERVFPIGARLELTTEAHYYGGEIMPAGSVLTMVGFSTTQISRGARCAIGFTPVARFPDGTFRSMPADVKLAA